jgi:hypothetical protein
MAGLLGSSCQFRIVGVAGDPLDYVILLAESRCHVIHRHRR